MHWAVHEVWFLVHWAESELQIMVHRAASELNAHRHTRLLVASSRPTPCLPSPSLVLFPLSAMLLLSPLPQSLLAPYQGGVVAVEACCGWGRGSAGPAASSPAHLPGMQAGRTAPMAAE